MFGFLWPAVIYSIRTFLTLQLNLVITAAWPGMHARPNNRSFIYHLYISARGVDKVGMWRGKDNVAFKTLLDNNRWLLSDLILKKELQTFKAQFCRNLHWIKKIQLSRKKKNVTYKIALKFLCSLDCPKPHSSIGVTDQYVSSHSNNMLAISRVICWNLAIHFYYFSTLKLPLSCFHKIMNDYFENFILFWVKFVFIKLIPSLKITIFDMTCTFTKTSA